MTQTTYEESKVAGSLTDEELAKLKPLLEKLFRTTPNVNVKSHAKGLLLKLVGLY